jgi:ribokinase
VTTGPDVVVVGSVNRDHVCRVDTLPALGQTVLGGPASVGSGGKGGNQAVAASLMGARTVLVARVGDDDDGRLLLADLHAAGVDTREVRTAPARTGTAFVLVCPDGENAIIVAPGANDLLEAEEAAAAVRRLSSSHAVVVTQAEIPPATLDTVVRAAAELGCRAVLNLAPYRPTDRHVLALCDPLVVNESEAAGVLGRDVSGPEAARAAAAELAGLALSAVLTVGARGAFVAEGDTVEHVAGRPADAVDTTGAGDAFTGALAAALSAGHSLRDATRIGVLAGAHAVGRAGAQASFPDAAELGLAPLRRAEPGR